MGEFVLCGLENVITKQYKRSKCQYSIKYVITAYVVLGAFIYKSC
jgi:hypothetical protein